MKQSIQHPFWTPHRGAPDRVMRTIASCIVWLEGLAGSIQDYRLREATKLAKQSAQCPRIYETKVINQNGDVIATLKDLRVE